MLATAKKLYMKHPRWWNNSAISIVMWALGWYLVYLLATHTDLSTQYSRYSISLAMTIPTFCLHIFILWKDRQTDLRTGVCRWWLFWLVSHVPDLGVNWLMVKVAGWPFLAVYGILLVPTALYTYWVRNKFVFVPAASLVKTNTV